MSFGAGGRRARSTSQELKLATAKRGTQSAGKMLAHNKVQGLAHPLFCTAFDWIAP